MSSSKNQRVGTDAITILLVLLLVFCGGYFAVSALGLFGDSIQDWLGYSDKVHADCRHFLGTQGDPLFEWRVRSNREWYLEPREAVEAYEECIRIHGAPAKAEYTPTRVIAH
jgi:hypothetical protein